MDACVMDVIEGQSLYQTVINVARYLFLGGTLTSAEREELSTWILGHQNRQHGFSFYPTEVERKRGIQLLSGERPRTTLAADNAVEMETLRLLSLLCPDVPGVRPLFERAERRLSGLCYGRVCPTGECACASISVLRYRTARGAGESVAMGIRGIEVLRQARVGEGKWRCFPFYYTLLWLAEPPAGLDERAHSELSYARDRCKRLLSRMRAGASGKPFGQVRAKILQDALARVGGTTGVQSAMFEMDGIGVLRAAPLAMV